MNSSFKAVFIGTVLFSSQTKKTTLNSVFKAVL